MTLVAINGLGRSIFYSRCIYGRRLVKRPFADDKRTREIEVAFPCDIHSGPHNTSRKQKGSNGEGQVDATVIAFEYVQVIDEK